MTWDEVCDIASALPLVVRGTYHGYPALRVQTKFLARLSDDHASVEFKSVDPNERELLLEMSPEIFHLPPNFRGAGVFARLATLDDEMVRHLLDQR